MSHSFINYQPSIGFNIHHLSFHGVQQGTSQLQVLTLPCHNNVMLDLKDTQMSLIRGSASLQHTIMCAYLQHTCTQIPLIYRSANLLVPPLHIIIIDLHPSIHSLIIILIHFPYITFIIYFLNGLLTWQGNTQKSHCPCLKTTSYEHG